LLSTNPVHRRGVGPFRRWASGKCSLPAAHPRGPRQIATPKDNTATKFHHPQFLKSSLRPLWRRCSRGAEDPTSAKTSSPFPSDSRRANRAPTHGAGDAAQRSRASAHEFVGDYYPCVHEIRRERERHEGVLFAQRLQTGVRFISNVAPGCWVPPAPCMIPPHRRR